MSPEFPPRPSKRTAVALAVVALVTFLYSVVVTAQILLWFVLVGVAIGLYLTYLLIVAVFRLVEAVERIATAAEVDSGIRTAAEARTSARTDDGDATEEGSDDATEDRSNDATDDQSDDETDDQSDDADASEESANGASPDDPAAGASPDDPDADGSALDGDATAPGDTPATGPSGSDDAPERSPDERPEGG